MYSSCRVLGAEAFREAVEARTAAYKADAAEFEDLLNAQQRLLDAELAFHVAKTEYELAIAQVQFESADLLGEFAINLVDDISASTSAKATERKERVRQASQNGRLSSTDS